ncbi:MAG: MarR family transcriptional regulator [Proteobacteria bacterium]|nr:MarR family transcriptional regulator [Pseudomonadota bacterium]
MLGAEPLVDSAANVASVLQQLRVVLHAVKAHFQEVEQVTGVGGAQVWALSVIRDRPGIGVTDLARALSIRQPTASILAKNLVRQRLIQVRRVPSDRRSVQLKVLARGEEVLRLAPKPFSGILPKALSSLDPECLQRLHADLELVVARLGTYSNSRETTLDRL